MVVIHEGLLQDTHWHDTIPSKECIMRGRRVEIDIERLQKLYVKDRKSFAACAEILGCSVTVVRNRLKELNIKPRGNTEWAKGHQFSAEHMARLHEGRRNTPVSAETREKIGAHFRGKTLTEEHKRKISESNKGKKCPWMNQWGKDNPNWTGGLSDFFRNDPVIQECYRVVRLAKKKRQIVMHPCEICGKLPARAHHDDYGKPMDVRWLCDSHHKKFHMEHRFKEYRYVPIGERNELE